MPTIARCLTRALLLAALFLPCAVSPARDFSVGIELPVQLPFTPAVENSLRELGIDYVNYYILTAPEQADPSPEKVNNEAMALCRRLGLDFSIAANLDPPDALVRAAVAQPGFKGLIFDELEHLRLVQAKEMKGTPPEMWLANPDALTSFSQADAAATAGFARVGKKFKDLGAPAVVSTHVWPVLLHQAARAGLIPCPKICKEEYSPVSLAIGLGAAVEYNQPLWADCDLWYHDLLPGHPPEELKSNLQLAYWLGAERVYIEGSGFNLTPQGNQGIPFTMMTQIKPDLAQLTAHGEALRWFCREYLPAHPRPWSWRNVKPDIALVRFEDTDHGQRFVHGDTLFGSSNLHSSPDTEGWFQVWNVLTRGVTGRDGLTNFKWRVSLTHEWTPRQEGFWPGFENRPLMASRHKFFSPLKGAVMFDDQVGYERLKDIPLIYLCGVEVSDATMAAIRKCVAEGAICVAWGPLARRHGFPGWTGGLQTIPEGKGKLYLTDDFERLEIYQQIGGLLGRADEITYRFADAKSPTITHRVTLHRGATDNEVSVDVTTEK